MWFSAGLWLLLCAHTIATVTVSIPVQTLREGLLMNPLKLIEFNFAEETQGLEYKQDYYPFLRVERVSLHTLPTLEEKDVQLYTRNSRLRLLLRDMRIPFHFHWWTESGDFGTAYITVQATFSCELAFHEKDGMRLGVEKDIIRRDFTIESVRVDGGSSASAHAISSYDIAWVLVDMFANFFERQVIMQLEELTNDVMGKDWVIDYSLEDWPRINNDRIVIRMKGMFQSQHKDGHYEDEYGYPEPAEPTAEPYGHPEPATTEPYCEPAEPTAEPYVYPESTEPAAEPYGHPEPAEPTAEPYGYPEPTEPAAEPHGHPEPATTEPYCEPAEPATDPSAASPYCEYGYCSDGCCADCYCDGYCCQPETFEPDSPEYFSDLRPVVVSVSQYSLRSWMSAVAGSNVVVALFPYQLPKANRKLLSTHYLDTFFPGLESSVGDTETYLVCGFLEKQVRMNCHFKIRDKGTIIEIDFNSNFEYELHNWILYAESYLMTPFDLVVYTYYSSEEVESINVEAVQYLLVALLRARRNLKAGGLGFVLPAISFADLENAQLSINSHTSSEFDVQIHVPFFQEGK